MTHVLRDALLSKMGDALSTTLTGRATVGSDPAATSKRTDQHRHAHYLAFDSRNLQGAGTIDSLVLWAPEGLGDEELDAIARLRHLRPPEFVKDVRPARLGIQGVGGLEVIPELAAPAGGARRWVSATPFLPGTHPHRRVAFDEHVGDQVLAEIGWRLAPGLLPERGDVAVSDDASWRRYRRHRPNSSMKTARAGRFVTVELPEPYSGPLVLGALSHFGLGLLVPVD